MIAISEPIRAIWRSGDLAIWRSGDLAIIAGRTGHGKSTVVFNLLAEWLATYPEQSFPMFSYELPKEAILLRMLSILTRRQGQSAEATATFSAVCRVALAPFAMDWTLRNSTTPCTR